GAGPRSSTRATMTEVLIARMEDLLSPERAGRRPRGTQSSADGRLRRRSARGGDARADDAELQPRAPAETAELREREVGDPRRTGAVRTFVGHAKRLKR